MGTYRSSMQTTPFFMQQSNTHTYQSSHPIYATNTTGPISGSGHINMSSNQVPITVHLSTASTPSLQPQIVQHSRSATLQSTTKLNVSKNYQSSVLSAQGSLTRMAKATLTYTGSAAPKISSQQSPTSVQALAPSTLSSKMNTTSLGGGVTADMINPLPKLIIAKSGTNNGTISAISGSLPKQTKSSTLVARRQGGLNSLVTTAPPNAARLPRTERSPIIGLPAAAAEDGGDSNPLGWRSMNNGKSWSWTDGKDSYWGPLDRSWEAHRNYDPATPGSSDRSGVTIVTTTDGKVITGDEAALVYANPFGANPDGSNNYTEDHVYQTGPLPAALTAAALADSGGVAGTVPAAAVAACNAIDEALYGSGNRLGEAAGLKGEGGPFGGGGLSGTLGAGGAEGNFLGFDTDGDLGNIASDTGRAAGEAGGGSSGGWSDSGGSGASNNGAAGGNQSSPSNDNDNQGGGDGDGHDPDGDMPNPDGPEGGGPNWNPVAAFVNAVLSALANPGSLPAEVEMPNPDGTGPIGPNVRMHTVLSAPTNPGSLPSLVEMPNPDGTGPIGPNVRMHTVLSAPTNPGSLPSLIEMPNPDGTGPVGPNVRAAATR
jgi:hypothetical protein